MFRYIFALQKTKKYQTSLQKRIFKFYFCGRNLAFFVFLKAWSMFNTPALFKSQRKASLLCKSEFLTTKFFCYFRLFCHSCERRQIHCKSQFNHEDFLLFSSLRGVKTTKQSRQKFLPPSLKAFLQKATEGFR